ncbi:MAG: amidase [Candidatus Eremiobacteraeota bacterium]|nr:amidase [Candidatus Eremiobacteraeota bacterium]
MRIARLLLPVPLSCVLALAPAARAEAPGTGVVERAVADLGGALRAGTTTSVEITRAYLARIAAIDVRGPALHSVISLAPHALDDALASDRARAARGARGPLDGIPVLIKDNVESGDGTATTAGSDALAGNVRRGDAPLVKRLRDAGAIVIGKTNLSEWANARSSASISGWSAVGGLVKNPYALDRNACGSSSGTAAAIAASLAAVGVGTETDGSVTCPSSMNGLVGLKPTVGLISRAGVVPISHVQDTPGPMGRSVADVAALLTVIAGSDPRDPATRDADTHKTDYGAGLSTASLAGMRLGVLGFATAAASPAVDAVFARAVAVLRAHGATVVELAAYKPDPRLGAAENAVLDTDLKSDLDAYLAATPATVRTRTLADVIAFDRNDPRELALFGQDAFEKAEASRGQRDPRYLAARALAHRLAGPDGIDRLVVREKLDALIAPSFGPAWRTDTVDGDNGGAGVSSLPAVAGYPHLTVPMGAVRGLPVGISFIGRAWSERALLRIGAAYERASRARRAPRYLPSVETGTDVAPLLAPARTR